MTEPASDRKHTILDAACVVIARDGAARLRVADVAAEAGVSTALVHYYFPARADLCSYVAFTVYCNSSARDVLAAAYQAWLRKDADRVFSWAASVYPALFGGSTSSGVYAGYYFRYHPAAAVYLGLQESTGELYVHDGGRFNFMDAGALRNYLDAAAAAGY